MPKDATEDHPATSPSSRRAWIEIHEKVVREWLDYVALLAEGVDRNLTANKED